jgi:hypothetical protein
MCIVGLHPLAVTLREPAALHHECTGSAMTPTVPCAVGGKSQAAWYQASGAHRRSGAPQRRERRRRDRAGAPGDRVVVYAWQITPIGISVRRTPVCKNLAIGRTAVDCTEADQPSQRSGRMRETQTIPAGTITSVQVPRNGPVNCDLSDDPEQQLCLLYRRLTVTPFWHPGVCDHPSACWHAWGTWAMSCIRTFPLPASPRRPPVSAG